MKSRLSPKKQTEILKKVGLSTKEIQHLKNEWEKNKNKTRAKETFTPDEYEVAEMLLGNNG